MKTPSKNMSKSLRGQSPGGKGGLEMSVGKLKSGGASMVMVGEGSVQAPPTMRHERSAAHFTDPMSRFGGKE